MKTRGNDWMHTLQLVLPASVISADFLFLRALLDPS